MRTLSHLFLLIAFLWLSACAPQASQEANAQEAEPGQVAPIPPRANDEVRPSPNAMVVQAIGTTVATISYGRPGVKGREVFGGLEPYGEVWRAGANEATVLALSDDVTINGEALPAGAYSIFAIPEEGEWTVIFNSDPNQWGAYNYDSENDALRISVAPEEGAHQEWLSFAFEDLTDTSAVAVLHWSDVRVPFTIATE